MSATGETWLMLGGSSAIARAFALETARQGRDVLLAGRDLEDLERSAADIRIRTGRQAEAVAFDATAFDTHAAFVAACRGRGAKLNLFLAFSVMPTAEGHDADFAAIRHTVETNYLGAVSVLSRLLPVLEAQGSGAVVVLGSVAGARGRLKNYVYGSAKAGLHAYLQGLRARLWWAGVSVITVKPGFVDTAMTWGTVDSPLTASPEQVARRALKAVRKGDLVVYTPWFWFPIMTLIKAIPEAVFRRMTF